ncbi:hypothetical protein [Halomonas cupida]|uniref:hypothetical protein n=1 Tax=Halomonas cupida TaxID=44933 RepID=UPI003A945188
MTLPRHEMEMIAKAVSMVLTDPLKRLKALEARLDAMPEPTQPTLRGLDSKGLGRLATLEHKVAELERHGVRYRGVWRADQSYEVGEWVTAKGSGWIAVESAGPGEKPGEGLPWRLAIKAGRDARPCRCNRGGNRHEQDE